MYEGTVEVIAKVNMKVKVPVQVKNIDEMYDKEEIYNKLYHDNKDLFMEEAEVTNVDID